MSDTKHATCPQESGTCHVYPPLVPLYVNQQVLGLGQETYMEDTEKSSQPFNRLWPFLLLCVNERKACLAVLKCSP